jgi:hypothetical protein
VRFLIISFEGLGAVDHVDDVGRGKDVQDLHDGVVERVEGREKI